MSLRQYSIGLLGLILALTQLGNRAWTQEKPVAPLEYVGSKQCKFCHNKPERGEQYTVWKSHKHSHAFETLFTREAARFAKIRRMRTAPSESAACLKCHVTGYDVVTQSYPEKISIVDGVQCETCHGPASAHVADGKILRMNKDAVIDISANIRMPDEGLCVTCHNPESPPWNPEKFTTKSGEKTGFDFDRAVRIIAHGNPSRAGVDQRETAATPGTR